MQETGDFFRAHGQLLARGYAGRGPAKNDPDQQCTHDMGPLPRGFYSVRCAQNHPRLGPVSLPLTPDPNNHMCCRSDFFIHGDSTTDLGNASNGCIVLPRPAREAIDGSEDKRLQVVRSSVLVALGTTTSTPV